MSAQNTASNPRNGRWNFSVLAPCLLALGGALFLHAAPMHAQQRQTNFQLCFPSITWFGGSPPTIDGDIVNDPGWHGAFRYVFGNGTTSPDVVMQGIRDNSNLYLAIRATNLDAVMITPPTTLDSYQSTLVVLTFDPGTGADSLIGGDPRLQRIHIYPIIANAVDHYKGPVFGTEYWNGRLATTGTGTNWDQTGSTTTSWLQSANVQVGYDKDPITGLFSWSLEMKLPILTPTIPGLPVPTSGFFGLYVDVFPVKNDALGAYLWPNYWPTNTPEPGCNVGGCTPDRQTPVASAWGNATMDSSCGGASMTLGPLGNNIYTDNVPDSKIALDAPNNFHAYIQNTSIDASTGTAVPIPAQVKATFKIANWGLPSYGSWGPVRTDAGATLTNPAVGSIDASLCSGAANNSNSACVLTIGPWNLSGPSTTPGTEAYDYKNANMEHQCILVQLESAPGSNTVVLNSAAQRNMDFGNASRFERIAEISAKGYPRRPDNADGTQNKEQIFDLHVTVRQEVVSSGQKTSASDQTTIQRGKDGAKADGRVVSQLTWIARGCRHTGYFMTIKKQRLEICDPVGAFGYVIRHEGKGPVEKWELELTGPGLEKVPGTENSYRIHVPQDGVATVSTRAEPKEQRSTGQDQNKVAVFFDAGAGIPHSTFGSAFNPGFSFNAGLEYIATSHFSAEGIFGYHRFPAQAGNALDLYQFSANGKAYLTSSGSLRPFVNAGIGGYKFSPGSTYVGGNFGAGILYDLTSHWGLQASYNFHVVNTPGAAAKFSTLQAGIRYVF